MGASLKTGLPRGFGHGRGQCWQAQSQFLPLGIFYY
jgi:hypothetical protein